MIAISDFGKTLIIQSLETNITSLKIYVNYSTFSTTFEVIGMFVSLIR